LLMHLLLSFVAFCSPFLPSPSFSAPGQMIGGEEHQDSRGTLDPTN